MCLRSCTSWFCLLSEALNPLQKSCERARGASNNWEKHRGPDHRCTLTAVCWQPPLLPSCLLHPTSKTNKKTCLQAIERLNDNSPSMTNNTVTNRVDWRVRWLACLAMTREAIFWRFLKKELRSGFWNWDKNNPTNKPEVIAEVWKAFSEKVKCLSVCVCTSLECDLGWEMPWRVGSC